MIKLSAQFDFERVDHEKDNTVRLLVTVEAPPLDWVTQRPQICVLPVLDVSSSMEGAKFEYARQACTKLVEQLKPGDYAGFVTFGSRAEVVVKPRVVSPELKTELLRVLGRVRPNGGTNFGEALTASASALESLDLGPHILRRAIFFTDGEPTTGLVERGALKSLLTQNLQSFSMSFFGYGDKAGGGCDQQFLTDLSELGKGNYAYVQNPDDALAAFGRELGGLLSTYATDLRLVIEPRNGHSIEKQITAIGPSGPVETCDVTELALELGDILAEEHRHVVLECSVKKQDKALPRDFTAFNVTATCRRLTQDGTKAAEELTAPAKIRFVRPDDVQKVPTPEVDKIVALHQLALAQRDAEAKAAEGKFVEAQDVLKTFSAQAQTRGYVVVAGVASNLGEGMQNQAVYGRSQGYRKSLGKGLLRSMSLSSSEEAAQVALSNLGGSPAGSSAQLAYSEMFVNQSATVIPSSPNGVDVSQGVVAPAPSPILVVKPDETAKKPEAAPAPVED